MTHDDSENKEPRYTLRPTFTPLPHTSGDSKQQEEPNSHSVNTAVRAANEDDDLYDPYSDYHDGTLRSPEYEPDPWR